MPPLPPLAVSSVTPLPQPVSEGKAPPLLPLAVVAVMPACPARQHWLVELSTIRLISVKPMLGFALTFSLGLISVPDRCSSDPPLECSAGCILTVLGAVSEPLALQMAVLQFFEEAEPLSVGMPGVRLWRPSRCCAVALGEPSELGEFREEALRQTGFLPFDQAGPRWLRSAPAPVKIQASAGCLTPTWRLPW